MCVWLGSGACRDCKIATSHESGYDLMAPGMRKIRFGSRVVLIYIFLIYEIAISHESGYEFTSSWCAQNKVWLESGANLHISYR
jgi:hypothetical protein